MTHTVCFINANEINATSKGHFKFGVPFKKGMWNATSEFCVKVDNSVLQKAYCRVTQLWPDGSIKWLLCEGLISSSDLQLAISATHLNVSIELLLPKVVNATTALLSPVSEGVTDLTITLDSGSKVKVNKDSPLNFTIDDVLTTAFKASGLTLKRTERLSFSYNILNNACKNVAVSITQHFALTLSDNKLLDIKASSTLFLTDGTLVSEVSFTNPLAAAHPNGQWDLGDPNSIFVQSLSLTAEIEPKSCELQLDNEKFDATDTPIHLYQASSGYANWQSKVHVNKDNDLPLPFKGYRLSKNNEVISSGAQAEPLLAITDSASTKSKETSHLPYYIGIKEFWQNFPSSATLSSKEIDISLLGATVLGDVGDLSTELQPGEQKARQFWFATLPIKSVHVEMNAQYVAETENLPFFQASSCSLQHLIDKAINGSSSLFQKRLDIDEFGWRNYGELYADHEKALAPEVENFVSHYNNQYDPIYGMLCQWLSSGDSKWFELADSLARHVADIDVYHTSLDKPEYSGGLFWHTDHYVQACTATHRTYSKHQPTGVYDDHAGGGGPGGQHCYTNGLTLHHLLTGYEASKAAVLSIANWITHYYEGDNTLLGALLALKNSRTPGVKNVKTGKYPLDRGTGNYIQALLDRFELLGNLSDVEMVGQIIRNTISTADTFELLSDVERTWFYTVLLQAVCRFVTLKHQLQQYDEDYFYATQSLVHYATWMAMHEYAYLDKPEILEFPNQTWSGQDLRKICILRFAANFLGEATKSAAIAKAEALEKTVLEKLSNSVESESTRVLCLMMQNSNFMAYQNASECVKNFDFNESSSLSNLKHHSSTPAKHLFKHLKNFSMARERSQLVKRFPQFQKWLGKP